MGGFKPSMLLNFLTPSLDFPARYRRGLLPDFLAWWIYYERCTARSCQFPTFVTPRPGTVPITCQKGVWPRRYNPFCLHLELCRLSVYGWYLRGVIHCVVEIGLVWAYCNWRWIALLPPWWQHVLQEVASEERPFATEAQGQWGCRRPSEDIMSILACHKAQFHVYIRA